MADTEPRVDSLRGYVELLPQDGVDKLLHRVDLVTVRVELEDEYVFAVELTPTQNFAIEARLKKKREGGAQKRTVSARVVAPRAQQQRAACQ